MQYEEEEKAKESSPLPKFFSLKDLFEIDFTLIENKVFKMFDINNDANYAKDPKSKLQNQGQLLDTDNLVDGVGVDKGDKQKQHK